MWALIGISVRFILFPKASPMLGFSFSLLKKGVERDRTGPWCGRGVWWWSGMGVIRMGVMGVWYGIGVLNGMGVIRDGYDGCGRGWGLKMEGARLCVDGCADGTGTGARLDVDGRGQGCGWNRDRKMEGSAAGRGGVRDGNEIGCGPVWTGRGWKMEGGGVWVRGRTEEGRERDWVWTGVDGGVDGTETGARVWMGGVDGGRGRRVWIEDGGERDWVWSGVDGGGWKMRGARLCVDGCWWKRAWVWTGVDGVADGRWRGARLGVNDCGRGCGWNRDGKGARLGVEGMDGGVDGTRTGVKLDGRGRGWNRDGSETGCGRVRLDMDGVRDKISRKLKLKGILNRINFNYY